MPKFTVSLKLLEELGYTIWFIHDTCLITVNHWIPIGCNTFLWESRASSRDVSTIKKTNQNSFAYVQLAYWLGTENNWLGLCSTITHVHLGYSAD